MNSQIYDAATTGKRPLIKPWFVGPISIVKDHLHRKNVTKLALADELVDMPHPRDKTIREIDCQQPIRPSSCIDHGAGFLCGAAQRLLAEHRCALLQRCDSLLGVQRAGRSDDN